MKKNLLFIMPSLSSGGGEKSLVNLLYQIDYSRYNVDLFLFSRTGVFMNSLPREVNILGFTRKYKVYRKELKNSVKEFLSKGQVTLAYSRLMFAVMNRAIRNTALSEQYTWKYSSQSIDPLEKEYDAAIGYLEKSSIYFAVDKVKSRKKIGWIHTNYSDSGMNNKYDTPYFDQLDHIVTVSNECAKSLTDNFADFTSKIKVIHNIVSPSIIHTLSNISAKDDVFDPHCTNIVTIARLSREKGIDMAIKACRILLDKGCNVKWLVLGEGSEREVLDALIAEHKLHDRFLLLGTRENPYPYLKNADIYVQPSRYEGKSIAIDEAKIVGKPIVVTRFDTAKDQIDDCVNGMIVHISEQGIADGIIKLIENSALRNKLVMNLSKEKLGTEEEIDKFYELVNR